MEAKLIQFVFGKPFREHFFVVFIGADNNRLQKYIITKFTIFVRSGGDGSGGGGGGGWI